MQERTGAQFAVLTIDSTGDETPDTYKVRVFKAWGIGTKGRDDGLLLLVGCFMDMLSAIVVIVPLLVKLGAAYEIDPLHLGIIFLANMELGLLAPTVGINIFLASYRFKKPVMEVSRAVLPMQGVLLVGVLLITYFPPLTTWLPKLFGK